MKPCYLGPITKHMNGYGFKLTFRTPTEAKEYKEMNDVIIKHDGYTVENKKGFHERDDGDKQ